MNILKRSKNKEFIRLKGATAFPGGASGKAALFLENSGEKKVKGKFILVAEATYPEYLPIMLKSSGIVTEIGGILSHAAIVAREFKIPCVVGVKGATSKIKSGDQVTIRKGGVVVVECARR
ncbi:MAG: PEP-utilizing enzyme [Candidatus Marsarchaeota archaeon]|nr:PEP-utilizing enzyme [Candidatus Marsarchaeota archaeon]